MPYTSLIEHDWAFGGADDDAVEDVRKRFAQKLKDNGGQDHISVERQMQMAQAAISGE